MRFVRRLLLALLLAAAIVMAASALYVCHWLATPLAIGNEPLTVEIQRGQSLTAVARDLAARGVLKHPRLLSLYASVTDADARIRAGEYAVPPGTSPRSLLELPRATRNPGACAAPSRTSQDVRLLCRQPL